MVVSAGEPDGESLPRQVLQPVPRTYRFPSACRAGDEQPGGDRQTDNVPLGGVQIYIPGSLRSGQAGLQFLVVMEHRELRARDYDAGCFIQGQREVRRALIRSLQRLEEVFLAIDPVEGRCRFRGDPERYQGIVEMAKLKL